MNLLVNIDVDDLERAVRFYTWAFELLGGSSPIYLLCKASGTEATPVDDWSWHEPPGMSEDESMPGYISHELQRCVEHPGEYLLLVRWTQRLHHFYDPFPTVLHYEAVDGGSGG